MIKRISPFLRAAIAVTVVLAACTGSKRAASPAPPPSPVPARAAELVTDGLCRLQSHGKPDEEGARIFFGEVHDTLHAIAAEVQERDRATVARLLEAKAAVEGPLGGAVDEPAFADKVDELQRRTAQALGVLGLPASGCDA